MKKTLLLIALVLPGSLALAQTTPATTVNAAANRPAAVPNVTITPASPQNANVRLRSSKSIGTPLYVLDGFILPEGKLTDLNPNDIAALNVLKGPSATQLYGAAGAAGVIQLTTQMPLLVRGQLVRTAAEKADVLSRGSSQRASAVRALTAEEAARYGLAPGTRALALTLEGKTLVSPQRVQALPFGQ